MRISAPVALSIGGIVVAGLAYVATRAGATPPSSTPVTFSGYLANGSSPAGGSHQIAFDLWDDATATDAPFHVCSMAAAPVTVASDGFFQVGLSTACVAAIPTHPSLWYQFTVDGTAFARTAIGAVPFAYWAGQAGGVLRPVTLSLPGNTVLSTFVSTLGTVCGSTAPTSGSFADPTYGTVGLTAAKTLCQTACSSASAHICLQDDLQRFQMITGVTNVATTGWVENGLSECRQVSPNCTAGPNSCGCNNGSGAVYANSATSATGDCTAGANPPIGSAYGPAGSALSQCDTVQPILCCD